MTDILHAEGFEVCSSEAELTKEYESVSFSGTTSFGPGKYGGKSWGRTRTSDPIIGLNRIRSKPFTATPTIVVQMRVFIKNPNNTAIPPLIELYSGTVKQCRLDTIETDGSGFRLRFSQGTYLLAETEELDHSTWIELELRVTAHASTGTAELKAGGVSLFALTNVPTTDGSATSYTKVEHSIRPDNDTASFFAIDDIVYTGGDFLGDLTIRGGTLTGDGDVLEFIPSAGTDHYALVDDASSDDDSTYIKATDPDSTDVFEHAGVSVVEGGILSLALHVRARLETSGARVLKLATVADGAESVAASGLTFDSTSYASKRAYHATDPATGGAWSVPLLEAAQIGVNLQ